MQRLTLPGLILFTVLTNLVPLYGVYNWDWEVRDVVLLYWVETVIVGVTYIIRIWTKVNTEEPWPTTGGGWVIWGLLNTLARGLMSAPFVVHFGGFCFILGMGLLAYFFYGTENFNHKMYERVYEEGLVDGLYLAAFGVLVSHILILAANWFGSGSYLRYKGTDGILRTYVRIAILMAVLVVPANLAEARSAEFTAIWVLVGLKILIDLFFLVYESLWGKELPIAEPHES